MAQELAEQVAERHGYQVNLSHLTLRGLCSECRALSPDTRAGG
jgi:Fe2+ or Zn2+ uptake regulation protein